MTVVSCLPVVRCREHKARCTCQVPTDCGVMSVVRCREDKARCTCHGCMYCLVSCLPDGRCREEDARCTHHVCMYRL